MLIVFITILISVSSFFRPCSGSVSLVLKVVDANNNPIKNAYITLLASPPGAYVVAGGYTDKDGIKVFELNNPPEKLTVFVSWMDVIVYQSTISPYIGSKVLQCRVGDLKIRVLTESLDPVKNSRVTISWNTVLGVKTMKNFTDSNGFAEFNDIPLITYNLSVYFNNIKFYSKSLSAYYIQEYTVLLKLYSLKLEILNTKGRPLSDASIIVEGASFKSKYVSGKDGIAIAHYLLPGNYTVKIIYMGLEKTLTMNISRDKFVKVIIPEAKKYKLVIHVLDDKDNPLPYIRITIDSFKGSFKKTGYTDEDGELEVTLPSGIYKVESVYRGYVQYKEINLNSDQILKFIFSIGAKQKISAETPNKIYIPPYFIIILIILLTLFFLIIIFHFWLSKTKL